MIHIRWGKDRGATHISWLESHHTFSFGNYYDPDHLNFASLRVINEDIIQPGQGFDTHSHRDMEIITYVLEGSLQHQDSLGNGSNIQPGDIQRMTAGTGIQHSEYNGSQSDPVHLLQVWIMPATNGLKPGYEQTHFPIREQPNQLHLVGSDRGQHGSVTIHQDVNLYASKLSENATITHRLQDHRAAWLHITQGTIRLNEEYQLTAGDAAAITDLNQLAIQGLSQNSELLLFDMAV